MDPTERIRAIHTLVSEIEDGLARFGRKADTPKTVGGMHLTKMIRYANEDAFLAMAGKFGALRAMLNTLESEIDDEIDELRSELRDERGEDHDV